MGDKGKFTLVNGPNESCKSSKFLREVLKNKKFNSHNFLERGSDERQYCSPNINLPVTLFCRSKFSDYKEYHSSLDNLNFISQKNLQQSLNILIDLVNFFEKSTFQKIKYSVKPNYLKEACIHPCLSLIVKILFHQN